MHQFNRVLLARNSEDGGLSGAHGPKVEPRTYKGINLGEDSVEVWYETGGAGSASTPPERNRLPLHLELRSHSPNGFAWGYGGSAPAQLALALLVHALGDVSLALAHYQRFKREHVCKWGDEWSITAEEIRRFVSNAHQSPLCAKFPLGRLVATPSALAAVPHDEIINAIRLHLVGEWGDLDRHDWNANNRALIDGSRLLSAYTTSTGQRFWIITEAGREATTVLLPHDY